MDPRTSLKILVAGDGPPVIPHLAVDCAILGFHEGELKVLLLRWHGLDGWSLPGGFVGMNEPLDRAAERVLRERTGLDQIYLQQFHAFGGTDRHEDDIIPAFRAFGVEVPRDHWLLRRVVSVAYVALVDFVRATPTPNAHSAECRWWTLSDCPTLLFDHQAIVARALDALRAQLDTMPIVSSLLPETFAMPELQRLYETVLGRSLDRRNFQRRMLDLGLVKRVRETRRRAGRVGRPGHLYRWVRSDAGGRR
jgi:8-oxo-dGTP diphosphatase